MGKKESGVVKLQQKHQLHLKRKIFHAFNGLLIFTIYQFDCVNWFIGGLMLVPFVILAWVLEIGRLKSQYLNDLIIKYTGQIMRAGEINKPSGKFLGRFNNNIIQKIMNIFLFWIKGICYFLTGVLISGLLTLPDKNILLMSVLYLGFGDPFASACGILTRPFSPRFVQLSNGKSLVGTFCDILFCMFLTYVFLIWRYDASFFTDEQFRMYISIFSFYSISFY